MEAIEHGVRTPRLLNRKAVPLPQRVSVKFPWYFRFSHLHGRGFFRLWFTEVWHLVCEYRYVCGICYLFFIYLFFIYMHPCSFYSLYACYLSPCLCVCVCTRMLFLYYLKFLSSYLIIIIKQFKLRIFTVWNFIFVYVCVCVCVYTRIVVFILFKIPQFLSYKYNKTL